MATTACDPIIIKGSKLFFKTNGTQFFVRGVVYSGGFFYDNEDSFTNQTACSDSIAPLQAAGINLISIFNIDYASNQTVCMDMFSAAGIYVLVYLETGFGTFDYTQAWTTDMYSNFTAIVDIYAPYTNVLGVVVAERNISDGYQTTVDAYVKAATRDVKYHMAAKNYRQIPVGYAAMYYSEDVSLNLLTAQYMSCGDSTQGSIDFWTLDLYPSWCNSSTSYADSGYGIATKLFKNFALPILVSKYGCLQNATTLETSYIEAESIYGPNMSGTFSGGIAYTSLEGLIDLPYRVAQGPDYAAVSQQLASATPYSILANAYQPSNTRAVSCPTIDVVWEARADILPPTPNLELCNCMMSSLYCTALPSIPDDDAFTLVQVLYDTNLTLYKGVGSNPLSGEYGDYSPCTTIQDLSWVFNLHYKANAITKNISTCTEISAYAEYQAPSPLSSACRVLIDKAGPLGDGVLSQSSSVSSGASGPDPDAWKSSESDSSVSLSTGAIAGIAVGGAFLVLAGVGILLWRRRRYVRYKKAAVSAADMDAGLQVQELHVHTERKAELGADDRRFEMETNRNTIEMPDLHSSPVRDNIYEAPDNSVSPVSPELSDPHQNLPNGFQHLPNRS